ncbi:unnamed protein product [Effrenium voratum]|nr:unnamed protein product [Effrenium voratum]
MTAGDEDSVNEDEEEEEEEVWACLGPADLEADLAAAEPQAAELRRSLEVDIDFFTARHAADRKMASGLQRLCAEAELLQFNLASMVAKVAHGPLAPGPASWGPGSNVFGPEAQVPLPSLSLAVPGGSGLAEYLERLAALPRCVAVARDLHFAASKLDVRQDEKDINRDRLEVNGVEVFGAQGGYQAAVAAVVGALRAGDAAAGLPAWGEEATCAAQLLLSNLNRTTSGFVAFEEILKLLDSPEVVISPESAKARPLEAALTGGVALARAHTRYAVHRAEGGRLAAFDVFVCFRVASTALRQLAAGAELQVPARVLIYRSEADP